MVAERYQVERTLGYEWPLMAPSKMNLLPRGCSANDCGEHHERSYCAVQHSCVYTTGCTRRPR